MIHWGLSVSTMQHHGAPTRLLDFTYSVYVAAYFALENADSDGCAVWAVNGPWTLDRARNALLGLGKKSAKRLLMVTQEFHEKD